MGDTPYSVVFFAQVHQEAHCYRHAGVNRGAVEETRETPVDHLESVAAFDPLRHNAHARQDRRVAIEHLGRVDRGRALHDKDGIAAVRCDAPLGVRPGVL